MQNVERYKLHLDPEKLTPADRLDILAEILADGFLALVENDLLGGLLEKENPGYLFSKSKRADDIDLPNSTNHALRDRK